MYRDNEVSIAGERQVRLPSHVMHVADPEWRTDHPGLVLLPGTGLRAGVLTGRGTMVA